MDRLLKIKTLGRDDSNADQYRYPYEPTPYAVLERLANSGRIRKGDTLLDYGCGKGRVDCYLSYQTRCHSIGVGMIRGFMRQLQRIKRQPYPAAGQSLFSLADAGEFPVPDAVNRAYFFNPFFGGTITESDPADSGFLVRSTPGDPAVFYYPSDEYLAYLMTVDELVFADEIDCRELFDGNDARADCRVCAGGKMGQSYKWLLLPFLLQHAIKRKRQSVLHRLPDLVAERRFELSTPRV